MNKRPNKPAPTHAWRFGYKAPTTQQLSNKQKRELQALSRKK